MALHAELHGWPSLSAIEAAMHETRMAVRAADVALQVPVVQHTVVLHYFRELGTLVAAQARGIAHLGPEQRARLFTRQHHIEIPGAIEVGFDLLPPPRLRMALDTGSGGTVRRPLPGHKAGMHQVAGVAK
jgi:hypothetical protein